MLVGVVACVGVGTDVVDHVVQCTAKKVLEARN